MATLSPDQVAQNWASRLGASTERIKQGVQAVTVAPGQAAAAAADVWLQNTQASQSKYKRNVANVSLQSWQEATVNKGAGRIAQGATAAIPKMTNFLQQFLPAVDAARKALPPRGTFEQNLARSAAMATALHNNFKYNKGA